MCIGKVSSISNEGLKCGNSSNLTFAALETLTRIHNLHKVLLLFLSRLLFIYEKQFFGMEELIETF